MAKYRRRSRLNKHRYRGRPSSKPKNDQTTMTSLTGIGRGQSYDSKASKTSDREALIVSLKRAHPEWTDQQIDIFVNPEGK